MFWETDECWIRFNLFVVSFSRGAREGVSVVCDKLAVVEEEVEEGERGATCWEAW